MANVRARSSVISHLLVLGLATMPLLVSCQPKEQTPVSEGPTSGTLTERGDIVDSAQSPKAESTKPGASIANARSQKITFRQPDGTLEFSLQFKPSGGKLLDEAGEVITHLILQSDGAVKLTDTNNNVVGYVVRAENTLNIESPKRTKTLFSYAQEPNGNALLTRHNGSTVYQLSATSGGYTVASGKGSLYTVQSKKGLGQLQTTQGQTLMATDSAIVPAALAAFGFEKLTQAQQAGLAYALSRESI